MNGNGIQRWVLLGALASAAALTSACEQKGIPKDSSVYEGAANEGKGSDAVGEPPATGGSGMAEPPPSSIRPATPDKASGAQGNQSGIGAPGYSTPREGTETSDLYRQEPVKGESLGERHAPDKTELPAGAH
ncbi:hypothetical protein [Stigmatella aurantiaca]|uniref:Lipoprotein n=1 Tax=Stigmatella aurantiaca (strain DW4/3-1) TaxID=378806 RepID=Q09BB5_STIAD|nr:hypothetical protein [Stigmatella aurantiaca]ADO69082.1 uncharacterized protein STAUR_1278 [Stigmatella aurantiaca DW4/3-1]EAU69032.1 hypothetical protein STIAU_8607 [Stigmatella aurantiaca DW4/3-1]